MKKLLLLLLSAVMIACSVSCKDGASVVGGDEESPSGEEYVDNYLYTMIGSVLYSISPYSASVVSVCPDPLCFHEDSRCPFYGVDSSNISMVGKYMYYLKDEKRDNLWWQYMKKLCRFDRESGKYEILYEPDDASITDLFSSEEYLYFNLASMDEEHKYSYNICRYDVSSGKIEVLIDEPTEDRHRAVSLKDGRVYWSNMANDVKYSTDISYRDRRDGDVGYSANVTMGGYYFKLETIGLYEDTHEYCFRLISINSETGEEALISDKLSSAPILHNGKVIYAKHGESKYLGLYLYEDSEVPQKYYDHRGGKYYICDPDGSNERLLCDLEGTGCAIPLTTDMIGHDGVGDWVAVEAYHYTEPDENGIIERDDNVYLLINIVSGEVKVAEIEKRN